MDSAALATSVHLVCRPRPVDAPVGDWADVLRELPNRVGDWMERLQSEGIRGADLVFNPSGGSWGPESDAIMSQRSRDGGVPIVFVHPVEFLVTAPDGSVLASKLHGAELDDPAQRDIGTVAYLDLSLPRKTEGQNP